MIDPDSPAARIARLESGAERLASPCGDGEMVWRAWGRGEPLVLLHGGYGSWLHWLPVLEGLAARRRVICADLPGLGDSADAPAPVTPHGIAAIVAEGLDHVLGPAGSWDVVGFSFGAYVGGIVAADHPPRVRRLVVVGAASMGLPRGEMPELVRAGPWMSATQRRAAHRHNLAALMLADPGAVDALAEEIQVRNVARARTRSRPFAAEPGLRDALARACVPFAGIWGERDATAAPHVEARRALLRSLQPGCPFEVVPDAGHWVMYEAPAAFERALEGVLTEMSAKR